MKTFVPAGMIFLSVLMVLSCATGGAAENGLAESVSADGGAGIRKGSFVFNFLRRFL
jgi:hypothetical protein